MSRQNILDPATLHRSPIFTKFVFNPILIGSSPESIMSSLNLLWPDSRGLMFFTALAMALRKTRYWLKHLSEDKKLGWSYRMWAGVVPQQPPTMLNIPSSANPFKVSAIFSGVSSYSPKVLGRPKQINWKTCQESRVKINKYIGPNTSIWVANYKFVRHIAKPFYKWSHFWRSKGTI